MWDFSSLIRDGTRVLGVGSGIPTTGPPPEVPVLILETTLSPGTPASQAPSATPSPSGSPPRSAEEMPAFPGIEAPESAVLASSACSLLCFSPFSGSHLGSHLPSPLTPLDLDLKTQLSFSLWERERKTNTTRFKSRDPFPPAALAASSCPQPRSGEVVSAHGAGI